MDGNLDGKEMIADLESMKQAGLPPRSFATFAPCGELLTTKRNVWI